MLVNGVLQDIPIPVREAELYLDIRSGSLNELLDFTDHAEEVFHKSSDYQKRTIMKLCFDGFIVKNQKPTSIWTPVFDILMDLQSPTQVSNIEPPKPPKGSKSLAVATVQSWKSGGPTGIRTPVTWMRTMRPRPLDDRAIKVGG